MNTPQSETKISTSAGSQTSGASVDSRASGVRVGGYAPLIISTTALRVFLCLAVLAVIASLLQLLLKTFTPADPNTTQLFVVALQFLLTYVSPVVLWFRIACLLFAIVATMITILNPHPYNRHCAIVGWGAAALCFFTLFFI